MPPSVFRTEVKPQGIRLSLVGGVLIVSAPTLLPPAPLYNFSPHHRNTLIQLPKTLQCEP